MNPLASAAPTLVSEVCSALASAGYKFEASQVASGTVERCTYDDAAEVGYVYFSRPQPNPQAAKHTALVAKTIPFLSVGFNVDIDYDGNVFGIEFLDRSDFAKELRDANVL